jgi:hypothetical protein
MTMIARKFSVTGCAALLLSAGFASVAHAGGELAQRRDISPLDRAKVLNVQSKRWLGFGATAQTTDTTIVPSTVGARVCTTNVGVPPQTTQNAGQNFGPHNQFGPHAQQDNIVVVSGDIISLCK